MVLCNTVAFLLKLKVFQVASVDNVREKARGH